MEFTIAATSHEPTCCRARHNLEESSHAHVRPPATCFNCAVILTTPVGVVMTTHVLRKFQPSGMPPLFFFFFFVDAPCETTSRLYRLICNLIARSLNRYEP